MNSRSDSGDVIDLDANATTPVDEEVLVAMLPFFAAASGNASSGHVLGRQAAQAVDRARAQVAAAVGAGPGSVVFTSGATEADNLALRGVWLGRRGSGRNRVITAATEHKAVLETAADLSRSGADVVVVGTDIDGRLDLDALREALKVPTALVSVMAANNETGAISPLADVTDLAHAAGALVHTDAAQVLGKVDLDVGVVPVDLASLSAHKAYGPKGIGALYVRPGTDIVPLVHGGGQERNLRSGTLNVPGIVGFGAAAALASARREADMSRLGVLRDELWDRLRVAIPGVARNGGMTCVLQNTLNIRLPRGDADDILIATPRIAAATGSACAAGSPEPSHVLLAMGLTYAEARASIRLSLGRRTSRGDVIVAADALAASYRRLV